MRKNTGKIRKMYLVLEIGVLIMVFHALLGVLPGGGGDIF
jgi:hypothetical protein